MSEAKKNITFGDICIVMSDDRDALLQEIEELKKQLSSAPVQVVSNPSQVMVAMLHSQHPLMGMYADAFMDIGGQEFLREWARENPSKFLNQMVRMVPNLQPTTGLQGDVNIRISNDLEPSSLDD